MYTYMTSADVTLVLLGVKGRLMNTYDRINYTLIPAVANWREWDIFHLSLYVICFIPGCSL